MVFIIFNKFLSPLFLNCLSFRLHTVNGGGGGDGDPLAAALAAGSQGGEMGDPTSAQATSINDFTGKVEKLYRSSTTS